MAPEFIVNNIYENEIHQQLDTKTVTVINSQPNTKPESEPESESDTETKPDEMNFESIKQLLKKQTFYILSLKPNTNDFIVLKRMYHIFHTLFKDHEITKEIEIIELNKIISNMLYIPLWDKENIVFIHLDNLFMFLLLHYSYDENIEKVIIEDIKNVSIYDAIDKILLL